MIKIYFDNAAVFFEFEGVWLGTLLYIGNNKFYLKYKADEGAEDNILFVSYNYIDAILYSLIIIGRRNERLKRVCEITAQMLTKGGEIYRKD